MGLELLILEARSPGPEQPEVSTVPSLGARQGETLHRSWGGCCLPGHERTLVLV